MPETALYPALVMIIRHGEKPGSGHSQDGGPDLSVLGSARAAALPSLFVPNPASTPLDMQQITCPLTAVGKAQFAGIYGSVALAVPPPRFPTPAFLFATQPGTSADNSHRPVETITPLAQALQFVYQDPAFAIDESFTNDKSPTSPNGITALASKILHTPQTYGGQTILVCWHHGTIPDVVTALGFSPVPAPWNHWPSDVFDIVLSLTWNNNGKASLAVGYQQLLFGDTPDPSGTT